MKKTPFQDFLMEKHGELYPMLLDDHMPDHFDGWVTELQADDWIDLGEEFALTIKQKAIEVVYDFKPFSNGKITNEVREGMLLGGKAAKKEILSALKTL